MAKKVAGEEKVAEEGNLSANRRELARMNEGEDGNMVLEGVPEEEGSVSMETGVSTETVEDPHPQPLSLHGEGGLYTVGAWKGRRQWRCALCAWDTLDGEEAMYEHLYGRHVAPEPVKQPVVQAYDKRGNPITR